MAELGRGENGNIGPRENSDALRTLAVRLLQVRPPGRTNQEEPQLFVGSLPDSLPTDIPIPDGCSIIGSLVTRPHWFSVVLDSDQPAEQVIEFYNQRLTADGWSVLDEMDRRVHGGFTHDFEENHATYCRGSREPSLTVQANAVAGKPTDVRLNLLTDPRYSPCSQRRRMMGRHSPIPALSPLPNSQQRPQGGGGGNDSWHSDAALETDLDLASLAEHYSTQLEQAGWTRTDMGHDGPLAWSTWSFRDEDDEPWRGLFFILKRPDDARGHFLTVRVDAEISDDYM